MPTNQHANHLPSAAEENGQHSQHDVGSRPGGFWKSKTALALIGFLLVAVFFLLSEHRAHALGILPYLIILACPLLHIFRHGGHGGHGKKPKESNPFTEGNEP